MATDGHAWRLQPETCHGLVLLPGWCAWLPGHAYSAVLTASQCDSDSRACPMTDRKEVTDILVSRWRNFCLSMVYRHVM